MTSLSPSPFDLSIQGSLGSYSVRRFRATERISTPYAIEVEADAVLDPGERPRLGARARLVSPRSALSTSRRAFHGLVTSCERRGRDLATGAERLRLTVEPRFAGLRHTRHRRIFHDLTSVAVAEQILREHRVPYRLRLVEQAPVHTQRIQYDESDLAFVERILFEEGVFYFFDHPAEEASDEPDATNLGLTEVLVLCDTARYYPRVEPSAPLVQRAFATDDDVSGDEATAFGISRTERARPSAVLVRGRDAQRPLAALGDEDDRRIRTGEIPRGGDADAEAGRRVFERRPDLVYEAQGSLEDRPPHPPPAARLLDEARADAVEIHGGTLNPHLMPGRVVRLEGLDLGDLAPAGNDAGDGSGDTGAAELVIVAIEHRGEAPRDFAAGRAVVPYRNEIVAAPAATTLRPARRAKPRVDGFDAAVVVGPEGQEIHTDEHGRVKVHFLWDLESPHDDKASAWLRVMQAWAGAGFGAQFLPRVGMEVMVAFVGGDVDRPIVAGCVHNGASPPPFRLPEEKTVSGVRTRTSTGGAGMHEIVLDDAAGKERISIRSEGHLAVHAKGEHSFGVSGGSEQSMASLRVRVAQDDIATIGGSVERDLQGSRSVKVGQDDSLQVSGRRLTSVAGTSASRITSHSSEEILGNLDVAVGGGPEGGFAALRVNGPIVSSTKGRVMLSSEHSIFVNVGKTKLEIDHDGVRIHAPRISLAADRIVLVASGSSLSLAGNVGLQGGEVLLASKAAQLKLDAEAHLDGPRVLLNCGPGAPPGASAGTTQPGPGKLTFQVTNPSAMGETEVTGVFLGPTGELVEHTIPPDGKVVLEGDPGDQWTLVEVRSAKSSWAKRGE